MAIDRLPPSDMSVAELLREYKRRDISKDRRGVIFTKLRARSLSMLRAGLDERYARLSDDQLLRVKARMKKSELPYHVFAIQAEVKKRGLD
ncbi:hypothetical protein SAMN05444161_8693 [Rhizobiales bacterium GAS191]|nr:hypothetical protein SAMN05444161_8693 [Rhizobiales bacterium GAS191]